MLPTYDPKLVFKDALSGAVGQPSPIVAARVFVSIATNGILTMCTVTLTVEISKQKVSNAQNHGSIQYHHHACWMLKA